MPLWMGFTFPPIKHLQLNQPDRQLAISEIWHAVLCLGPTNNGWSRYVAESPLTKGLFCCIEAIQAACLTNIVFNPLRLCLGF
jgi:hypothetical protein